MTTIHVAIDPGKQGAIAYFVNSEFAEVKSIPLIKTEVDLSALNQLLDESYLRALATTHLSASHNEYSAGVTTEVFTAIEDVHALFGASASATFTFGYGCGLLEGLIYARGYKYLKVQPKEWQKKAWLGIPVIKKTGKTSTDSKAMSRLALNRLYPNLTTKIPKSKDGMVDAILIGHWLVTEGYRK
jgi:hypothetical protein